MASNTMNKNIFAAFGMDETDVAQVAIDKISGSETTPAEVPQTKDSASSSNDDGWKEVKRKETPKDDKHKSKPLYTPKSKHAGYEKVTPKATPESSPKGDPLVLQLEDYPALGTKLTKAQKNVIAVHNHSQFTEKEKAKEAEYLDPRSASFASMADKDKVAKSLTCTKACRLVTRPYSSPKEGEDPKFGVCTRENCSFAHSDAELQVPGCGFDGNCRFMYGKRDRKTRKIIPDTQCRFRHSSETVDEYYKRSKVQRPDLPPTNEHSRKPRSGSKPSTSNVSAKSATPLAPGKYSAMPPPAQVNHSRRKSRWDEKPKESPKESPVRKSHNKASKDYSSSDESSSSESSSSESSSSESEGEYRARKRRGRRNRSHVKRSRSRSRSKASPAVQIIRVPTKELAEVAIKAAFDRGQYNVQVLVEGC